MKIQLTPIKIRDLVDGYQDLGEDGVIGYHGRLDIRPAYQREFVYDVKQQTAVIDTVMKGYPLNTMYWVLNGHDDNGQPTYEVLDGQQRSLSICNYVQQRRPDGTWTPGTLSINDRYFMNLSHDEQERLLDYELQVFVCDGTDSEKLEWFRTVNVAGVKLTNQELLNSVYAGEWLTNMKRKFSRTGCVAAKLGDKYVKGTPIRQELLEKTLAWKCDQLERETGEAWPIERYMALHQHERNDSPAFDELWDYYRDVLDWVTGLFPKYRREMKQVDWGTLYNQYHRNRYAPDQLEETVSRLMADDDVTRKPGIYHYVLIEHPTVKDERWLSIRAFSPADKRSAYERQHGNCLECGKHFPFEEMEGDHQVAWSQGGRTIPENCGMLCKPCNKEKSAA